MRPDDLAEADKRLEALHSYGILDTPPEAAFDDLTRLAAQICGTPFALVSLIDEARQWFKSRVGMAAQEDSLEHAFCTHAIREHEILIVPDTHLDPRFASNLRVIEAPRIRFYAGAVLRTPKGVPLGTLCVYDDKPHALSAEQRDALLILARQVMAQLELRRRRSRSAAAKATQSQVEQALEDERAVLETLSQVGAELTAELDLERLLQKITDAATRLTGAAFGALFYNAHNEQGQIYQLYTLSGAPREAFERYPAPRNTAVFAPTFRGEGVVRSADITQDPRYGKNAPHKGLPQGHLPVRSYLAVPVASRAGEVIGGLLFGHPEAGVFADRSERLASGIASQAAIAIDNARLYQQAKADLAARERAQEALRQSEGRYRTLLETIPQLVWTADVKGRCDYVNQQWCDYTGLPAQALIGSGWLETVHPEDREHTLKAWQAATRDEQNYEVEYRLRSSQGNYRWFKTGGRPLRDAQGEVLQWFGTCTDVTESVQAREALAADQARLEQLIAERTQERDRLWQLSKDIMGVTDFEGSIIAVNPACTTILGYTQEELKDLGGDALVHPEDRAARRVAFSQLKDGGPVPRFESRYRHKNGAYRWLSWTAVPNLDERRIYVTARDVTAEKAAAEALHQVEESLRQSQKMEAVGQLTGGIAHDFNNLLLAMNSSLELIRRKPEESERVRRWAETGLKAGERGAKLTGQLLAFSRTQKLELKPLMVSELLLGMRDLLVRSLGPLVRLQLQVDDAAIPVLADATQLELAILNLAINAKDAMPEGGKLSIWLHPRQLKGDPELPDGQYLEVCVADTGTGMAAEVAARAFEPFFTTKGVGQGTGLGLSQVYGMAQQGGGTVRIDSRLGEGTTVRLLLRRSIKAAVGERARAQENLPPAATGTATILVVDDDQDVRSMLVDSLEGFGYRVVAAEDGYAGLAALRRSEPDLMLLDFAMPGLNGAEVAREARALRPELPIVFVSGYSTTAAIEQVMGAEAMMLRKPFSLEQLEKAVAEALQEKA